MKLYTEAEIISAYEKVELCHLRLESFMESMAPIELPSDEEIEEKCNSLDGYEFDSHDSAFFGGAKWMRDKIQGGKQ